MGVFRRRHDYRPRKRVLRTTAPSVVAPEVGLRLAWKATKGGLTREFQLALNNLDADMAPTVNDDANQGYTRGSVWIYDGTVYLCKSAAIGAADWQVYAFGTVSAFMATVLDDADAATARATLGAASSTFAGCQARRSGAAFSHHTSSSWIPVELNAENFDTNDFHDTVTNNTRITIPSGKAGKYLFTAALEYEANATGFRGVAILVNGGSFNGPDLRPANSGIVTQMSTLSFLNLAVGDYVELAAFQSSGGALNLNTQAYAPMLSAAFLGG